MKQLNQRHVVKEQQKQREVLEFLETEKQNVEYDEMMANLKARNRLQIQQDLDTQIKLKHMDMVFVVFKLMHLNVLSIHFKFAVIIDHIYDIFR